MAKQRITLHFTKANTTGALAAFHWLMRQWVNGSRCSHLVLIRNHVTQALVVNLAHKNIDIEFFPSDARVQTFMTVVVVSGLEG